MDIFALSDLGLRASYKLVDFIFFRTPLGVLAFTAGFLWAIWQSVEKGNSKGILIFLFLGLTGSLLVLSPQRQAILSFIGQGSDTVSLGIIGALDQVFEDQLRFLNQPLGPQKLSLEANAWLYAPIKDIHLKEDLESFIYAYYLPSLMMYSQANQRLNDLYTFWPGDSRLISYYSSDEQQRWRDLQERLKRLIDDPQGPWIKVKAFLTPMMNGADTLDDQIMASLIKAQLQGSGSRLWWHIAELLQAFFPYIMLCANFCIYVLFPLLMLSLLIFPRMSLFLRYVELFLWVKSLYLSCAASHYISIAAMHIQRQGQPQANWFWDYPYFSMIASVLIYVLPVGFWLVVFRSLKVK